MFDSSSYSINGQSTTQSGNKAIADTGTTLMLCSDTFVAAVYQAIPGAKYDSQSQGYVFPASTTADQLPEVTVAVGDVQYTIQKEDLSFASAGNDMVYGGIQSRGDMKFDILGDVFLKAVYAVSSHMVSSICSFTERQADLRSRQDAIWGCAAHRANPKHSSSTCQLSHEYHDALGVL
jgi:hypothetical protein